MIITIRKSYRKLYDVLTTPAWILFFSIVFVHHALKLLVVGGYTDKAFETDVIKQRILLPITSVLLYVYIIYRIFIA